MERIFLRDVGTAWVSGDIRDYPHAVWKKIAAEAGEDLDEISIGVEDGARAVSEAHATQEG